MIEFYPQIRSVHILAVCLSGGLFALRGLGVLAGMRWPQVAFVRYLSYSIDTVLLTAALMLVTILPNCLGPLIVQATLSFSNAILEAAALGFLGLGAQPPLAEWGAMISSGRQYLLDQWWVATIPGLAIFIVSLGFNLLGDGLRDVFDPKSR